MRTTRQQKKLIHKREYGYIRVNLDWPCPWSYEFLSHTHANSGKEVHRVRFILLPCWGSSQPPRACFPLLSVPLWTRHRFCYNTSLPSFFFYRFLPGFLLVFSWLPHTRFYYFSAPSNLSLNEPPLPLLSPFALALALSQCCLQVLVVIFKIYLAFCKWV